MARRPRSLPGIVALAVLLIGAAGVQAHSDPSFNLVNRGTSAIRAIHVTVAGANAWGHNLLHRTTIPPGGTFQVTRRAFAGCVLDIKVVFADGSSEERRALNTCALDAVAVGGPEQAVVKKTEDDPSFRLINRGTAVLREFYVTRSGLPIWGRNRLAPGGLAPGAATVVRVARANQCEFDLRAVFADAQVDAQVMEQRHIDLCEITDVPVP